MGPDYTNFDQLNYLTSSRWKTAPNPQLLGPFTFTAQFNAFSNITVYFLCMCYSLVKQEKGIIDFEGRNKFLDAMLAAHFKDCFLLLTTIFQLLPGLVLIDWSQAI